MATFETVLPALRAGKKIRRKSWKDKVYFVSKDEELHIRGYLEAISVDEALADDWEVVDESDKVQYVGQCTACGEITPYWDTYLTEWQCRKCAKMYYNTPLVVGEKCGNTWRVKPECTCNYNNFVMGEQWIIINKDCPVHSKRTKIEPDYPDYGTQREKIEPIPTRPYKIYSIKEGIPGDPYTASKALYELHDKINEIINVLNKPKAEKIELIQYGDRGAASQLVKVTDKINQLINAWNMERE